MRCEACMSETAQCATCHAAEAVQIARELAAADRVGFIGSDVVLTGEPEPDTDAPRIARLSQMIPEGLMKRLRDRR